VKFALTLLSCATTDIVLQKSIRLCVMNYWFYSTPVTKLEQQLNRLSVIASC